VQDFPFQFGFPANPSPGTGQTRPFGYDFHRSDPAGFVYFDGAESS
jgi:hypothetical protein